MKRVRKKRHSLIGFICGIACAAAVGSTIAPTGFKMSFRSPEAQAQKLNSSEYLPANIFVELGKRLNPAVVNISTTQIIRGGMGRSPGYPGLPYDPFQQFFDQFMGGRPMPDKVTSLGSGFIIDESGLIVTNNHVVQNGNDIQVQLTEKSKKTYRAKVVGHDARTDIALIKIDVGRKLPVATLGDSDKIEVGEWVAAFGNPFGHGHSMTKGIISAKERDIELESASFPFLQTDASINPGNSGGPLVNTRGEVIGVNSAIDARAQGIGFAIPINVVTKLLPELKSKGKITRGYIGVGIGTVDERMQRQFNLKSDKGAIIVSVSPNSPADRGGIRPYDVVVEFNGKEVDSGRTLSNLVADTPVGQKAAVTVLRNGGTKTLSVRVGEKKDEDVASLEENPDQPLPRGSTAPFRLGMSLTDLTGVLSQQLQLSNPPKRGVVVVEVQPNSLADQAGIQIGDVILDINKKPVHNTREAIKSFQKGSNNLRILRGNAIMIVFMETQ